MSTSTESGWPPQLSETSIPTTIAGLHVSFDAVVGELDDQSEDLQRIRHIVEFVESELKIRDPMLFSTATISSLGSSLTKIEASISGHSNQSGASHLDSACKQADALLGVMATIPARSGSESSQSEVRSLRQNVERHKSEADGLLDRLRVETSEVTETISSTRAELIQLENSVKSIADTANGHANQQQNAFASAQDQRHEMFRAFVDEKRTESETAIDALTVEAELSAKKSLDSLGLILEESEKAKRRVEEILGIVGEEALVGGYSKNASEEERQAKTWRLISVASMSVPAFIGVWVVATIAVDASWKELAAKVALGIPLAAIAAYSAKQSNEHRHVQREAEHVALQLAALGPYLDDIDSKVERDRLLADIAGKFFGRQRSRFAQSDLSETPPAVHQAGSLLQGLNSQSD